MSKYRHVQVRLIRMLLRRLAGFVRRCKSPDLLAERVGIHRITNHYIEKRAHKARFQLCPDRGRCCRGMDSADGRGVGLPLTAFSGRLEHNLHRGCLGGFSLPEEHDQDRDPPRGPQDEEDAQQNVADED